MAEYKAERWYFQRDQLENSPSRRCGMPADKELYCRQQAARFLQYLGRDTFVTQDCINTAIVLMHRFYMVHSFTEFSQTPISICALHLAAKVEEKALDLEFILKCSHKCLNHKASSPDTSTQHFMDQVKESASNVVNLLQTLGLEVNMDHPHSHVTKFCQLVNANEAVLQTSIALANMSLHLTTLCLQYPPTTVACVCIHLACKWANWELPKLSNGKDWFWQVDTTVTAGLLDTLSSEFVAILDRYPNISQNEVLFSDDVSPSKISDNPYLLTKPQSLNLDNSCSNLDNSCSASSSFPLPPTSTVSTTGSLLPDPTKQDPLPISCPQMNIKSARKTLTLSEYQHRQKMGVLEQDRNTSMVDPRLKSKTNTPSYKEEPMCLPLPKFYYDERPHLKKPLPLTSNRSTASKGGCKENCPPENAMDDQMKVSFKLEQQVKVRPIKRQAPSTNDSIEPQNKHHKPNNDNSAHIPPNLPRPLLQLFEACYAKQASPQNKFS